MKRVLRSRATRRACTVAALFVLPVALRAQSPAATGDPGTDGKKPTVAASSRPVAAPFKRPWWRSKPFWWQGDSDTVADAVQLGTWTTAYWSSSIGPQPRAGGNRDVNSNTPYTVTNGDAYDTIHVGVTSSGVVTHSTGTLTVGTELDLGYNTGFTGTYNLSGGTLSLSTNALLYVGNNGPGIFTQTGGAVTVASGGEVDLGAANPSSVTSTYSISAGSLSTPLLLIGDQSPATFTQSGTSTVTTSSNIFTGLQFAGNANAVYQLNGGTLTVAAVTNNGATPNTGTFNFNGGTLQASASDNPGGSPATIFLTGIGTANVQANGAKIDTQNFTVTVAQRLLHDTTAGAAATDGGLTKLGTGTLILTGANTYNGPTTVSAGALTVSNNGSANSGDLASTGSIVLNNGGTLLLSGSTSSTDRLNNAATVTINGGGKISTGALKEGTAPTAVGVGGTAGVGSLTLAATTSSARATIDFGTGNSSTLVFGSLTASSKGAFVSILDFTGAARADSGAATNDRLLFTTDPGFSLTDLANWQFSNDAGTAFATGGLEIAFNGYYEIVPVPEPATWLAGALLLGATGLTICRRCARAS